jgi:hypothetical protein
MGWKSRAATGWEKGKQVIGMTQVLGVIAGSLTQGNPGLPAKAQANPIHEPPGTVALDQLNQQYRGAEDVRLRKQAGAVAQRAPEHRARVESPPRPRVERPPAGSTGQERSRRDRSRSRER